MHEMVSTWQAKSDVGFIIAGHTSFERLSAIADIIKEAAVTGTDCPYFSTVHTCKWPLTAA
jgi:hypothetical protein